MTGLAYRVKAKIEALGLTLRGAAEVTGVSKDTLSRVVRGKTPTLDTYQRLEAWTGERSADDTAKKE